MSNCVVTNAVRSIMLLAWAPNASSAAPRDGPNAGVRPPLMRKATSEIESYVVPNGRASAPFTPDVRLPIPSLLDERVISRSSSTLWRMSQTEGQDATPSPANFNIHSCGNDNTKCAFEGCNADGHVAECIHENCYTRNVADTTTCSGLTDGTDIPLDMFCLGEAPTKLCPPNDCKDVDGIVPGTTCSELSTEDKRFCENASFQSVIEIFCRSTCGLCQEQNATAGNDNTSANTTEMCQICLDGGSDYCISTKQCMERSAKGVCEGHKDRIIGDANLANSSEQCSKIDENEESDYNEKRSVAYYVVAILISILIGLFVIISLIVCFFCGAFLKFSFSYDGRKI